MPYKNHSQKLSKSLLGKQVTKIWENEGKLDAEGNQEQPCGVALYVTNVPKLGLYLHVTRYFEHRGEIRMAYRRPKGCPSNLWDDVYVPMKIAHRVAQEILKLAGVAEASGPPPEVADAETRRRQRQLEIVGAK